MGPMGAGVACQAAARWPALAAWWSDAVAGGASDGWHPWPADPDPTGGELGRTVGCLVTKRVWWERSPPALIAAGLSALATWAIDRPADAPVVMTLPGAGHGGLSPAASAALCREWLTPRFVVCVSADGIRF